MIKKVFSIILFFVSIIELIFSNTKIKTNNNFDSTLVEAMNIATASKRPLSLEDIIIARAKENERLNFLNETVSIDDKNNDEVNKNIEEKDKENITKVDDNELVISKINSDGAIAFFDTKNDKNLQRSNNSQNDSLNDKIFILNFDTEKSFDLDNKTISTNFFDSNKQIQLKAANFDNNANQKFNIEKEQKKTVYDFLKAPETFKNTSKNIYNELKFTNEEVEVSTLSSLNDNEINQLNESNFKKEKANVIKFFDFKNHVILHNSILSQSNSGKIQKYFYFQNYVVILPLILFLYNI
uniref:Uncharacterized protein n=2 Tax=Strongyloides stercoralis TaxID=6248 RepID=A0AAF5D3B5_STRER